MGCVCVCVVGGGGVQTQGIPNIIAYIFCIQILSPFMLNVLSHSYVDKSIFNFRVVGWYFSFLFKF